MEINFRITDKEEFEQMAEETGFKIVRIYGDYDYSGYNRNKSNFIIYVLEKTL